MTLETERLLLRRWRESDAESLYRYARDPAVGPIAGWPVHKSVRESRAIISTVLTGPEAYAICLKQDGKAIGAIELMLTGSPSQTAPADECELGFWLGRPFWGRGLVPEAARALLRRAFQELGMRTVWCGCYDGNLRSRRVQEKLGFVYHHTVEQLPVPLMNELRTEHISCLSRARWEATLT